MFESQFLFQVEKEQESINEGEIQEIKQAQHGFNTTLNSFIQFYTVYMVHLPNRGLTFYFSVERFRIQVYTRIYNEYIREYLNNRTV